MAKLLSMGRVFTDVEVRKSTGKEPYARFTLSERIGYGERAHNLLIQVWAFGYQVQRLEARSVKKGSTIWVSGSIDLVDYTRRDGRSYDRILKLTMDDWDFLNHSQAKEKDSKTTKACASPAAVPDGIIDGDREALPE